MPEVLDIDVFATSVFKIISDYFEITLYRPADNKVVFWGNPLLRRRGWKRELNNRLAAIHVRIKIERDQQHYRITAVSLPLRLGRPPLVNILLFTLTFLTVLIAATWRESGEAFLTHPSFLVTGLPFTLTLMVILLLHEMGHFLTGNRRGVIMSYPFFIPAPTFLGTFGAIIRSRTPIRNRSDLINIGAAGPLTGALPALVALIWGYSTSRPVGPDNSFLIWGDSLITWVLKGIVVGEIPAGMVLDLSPVALAGHVGLLVTMINLLPLGQLDGGHICYGLFGKGQHYLAAGFLAFLFILGWQWNGWWIWLVLALFKRPFHPPVIEKDIAPDKKTQLAGWLAMILFILCFVPIPIH
ncbi:MAG: site-2 protease family protein [Candidatus Zixiibacteriota bacterium]|nr:MAG: site-2 protease family protein [candidate division Zixibacteria bacterium]